MGSEGEMDWLIQDMVDELKGWGHTGGPGCEIITKTDGEPAIVALRDALLKYHGGIGILEQPEKGEKAENGYIEEAGKTVRELACTFITQVEEGVDDKLPLDCDLIPWIMRWAAMCHSRCRGERRPHGI